MAEHKQEVAKTTDAVRILHKHIVGNDDLRKKQLGSERAWMFLQTLPCPNVDIEREGTHKLTLVEVLSKYRDWTPKPESVSPEWIARAAKDGAKNINKMVHIWFEKMNLPTSNKTGNELFEQAMSDIIQAAIERNSK